MSFLTNYYNSLTPEYRFWWGAMIILILMGLIGYVWVWITLRKKEVQNK